MSDVMGYRGGEGVAEESPVDSVVRKIVTNKQPLLSSPGTLLPDTIYYSTVFFSNTLR